MSVFALDTFDEDNDAGSPLNVARTTGAIGTKVVLLGNVAVGKSCLARRLLGVAGDGEREREGGEGHTSTVGVDVLPATILFGSRSHTLSVVLCDISAAPAFARSRDAFYKDAEVLLLVYDVTCRDSFDDLENMWWAEVNLFLTPVATIVVGNKADLVAGSGASMATPPRPSSNGSSGSGKHGERAVSSQEGKAFAARINAHWLETSAVSGLNVPRLARHIASAALDLAGHIPLASTEMITLAPPGGSSSFLATPPESGTPHSQRPLSRLPPSVSSRFNTPLHEDSFGASSSDDLISSDDGQYVIIQRSHHRGGGGGGGCAVL